MDVHMKEVFGADRATKTSNIQDHAPPYQCGSMAEIAAVIPPLQKRARRLARYRAVPSWATPNEIHAMCLDGAEEAVEEFWRSGTPLPERMAWYAILESCMQKDRKAPQLLSDSEVSTIPEKGGEGPDFLRFINLLDGVGKMIFGGWLELIEDPYRHWQFGFMRNRGVTDCLAIR